MAKTTEKKSKSAKKTKSDKDRYYDLKRRILSWEKENYTKLAVVETGDGWYKLFDHSAVIYACQIAKRLKIAAKLVSNIMLDQLDRYIYYELGYKRYGRYVDDFYIVVTAEELAQLKKDISKIDMFLKGELELTLHPKKRYLQEVHKGVEFLGAVVYPNHLAPSKRFKNNFYKAAAEVGMGYRDVNSIISYLGLFKHYDSKKFSKRVFDYYGWDYSF